MDSTPPSNKKKNRAFRFHYFSPKMNKKYKTCGSCFGLTNLRILGPDWLCLLAGKYKTAPTLFFWFSLVKFIQFRWKTLRFMPSHFTWSHEATALEIHKWCPPMYSTSSLVMYLLSAGVSDTKIHQSNTHTKQAEP